MTRFTAHSRASALSGGNFNDANLRALDFLTPDRQLFHKTDAAQTVASSTAFVNITGMTAEVQSNRTYHVRLRLLITTAATPGIKVNLAGGVATANPIRGNITTRTASAMAVVKLAAAAVADATAGSAVDAVEVVADVTMYVTSGGTLIPRFAQQASNATAAQVLPGSTFEVTRIA